MALEPLQRRLRRAGRAAMLLWQQRVLTSALRGEQRRAARRARELELASRPQAFVLAVIAAMLIVFCASSPAALWWLGLAALGLLQASVRIWLRVRERARLSPAALDARPAGPLGRVELLADRLRQELRRASPLVREALHRPEETVEELRDACRILLRRERELRGALAARDEARLLCERAALGRRIERETDEVCRQRLERAASALDLELEQRAALGASASRLEAERTRILYSLEMLYTQLLRVRSADAASADLAGAAVRVRLEQMSEELAAVAEALDETHADLSRVVPVEAAGAAVQAASTDGPLRS
ncbi:MAG: hypothetical protein ACOX6T_14970 [Myxococcales bacterium]|jgi:hypothetical protein